MYKDEEMVRVLGGDIWELCSKGSFLITSSPMLVISCVFDKSLPNRSQVTFHYVFLLCAERCKLFVYIFAMLGRLCWMWAFSSCAAQASHCSGFSCYRAQALGHTGFRSCGTWAPQLQHMGLVARRHVESSQAKG